MTYYSVLAVTPTTQDWIPDYIGPANALVTRHGGKYLARTSSHERLEGESENAALQIIIEWPSREAAEAFMKDPAYLPHLKARTEGSISHHFLIEAKDDLAKRETNHAKNNSDNRGNRRHRVANRKDAGRKRP